MIHGNDEPAWLQAARRELGIRELPGTSEETRIRWYHSFTKLKAKSENVAWCAAFVCAMLETSGVRSTRSAAAKSYATYGKETYPEPGAIVVFGKSHPDAVGTGHVSFLVGIDGDHLLCLGGNQSNKVCIRRYPASSAIAYRWPEFS